jgi:hypothetical protein
MAGREKLPRCEEVVAFAEKLIVALTPLRELLSQELFEMKGVDEVELVREVARRLMRARFGEPCVDVADEHGFKIEYKCINEDGDVVEAGIHALTCPDCGLHMHATSYRVARSREELRRIMGLNDATSQ